MKKIIPLIALFLFLNSCSTESAPSYSLVVLPIGSVDLPTEFTLGETYPITVHYNLPTTCHYFNNLYYQKYLNTRTIAIESAVENRSDCQSLSGADTVDSFTFNFYVTNNGTYIFKFYNGKDNAGNDTYLQYEVPVN
jgi:hypothetical protein